MALTAGFWWRGLCASQFRVRGIPRVPSPGRSRASSASTPCASSVAVAPQSRLARRTSIRLEAENRLPSLISQISDRKLRTRLTNCAAGRACNPSLLVMRTSRCAEMGARLCPNLMPGSCPSADAETFRSAKRKFCPPANRSRQ